MQSRSLWGLYVFPSKPNNIYVFLCFFVNSYHNNNIYSFRLIWSEILGRSTDLFFSSKWALFLSFWPFFSFGWFHHIQRKNGFFFTQITQETLTFHKVSLKSTYYGWGALNEVVNCIITLRWRQNCQIKKIVQIKHVFSDEIPCHLSSCVTNLLTPSTDRKMPISATQCLFTPTPRQFASIWAISRYFMPASVFRKYF